jgi:uncharacterized small protein (DUF1192 family)
MRVRPRKGLRYVREMETRMAQLDQEIQALKAEGMREATKKKPGLSMAPERKRPRFWS